MTIRLFTLNLSCILHPWVLVAAMVVSEINDKLSPKNAPPTTMATMKGKATAVLSAIPTATGVRATIVPTEVPIDKDIKQAAKNMPASKRLSGRICSVRFTVASMAPIALADWAKAPAKIKIQIISKIFLSPAPPEKRDTRLFSERPRVMAMATTEEMTKATVIGTL